MLNRRHIRIKVLQVLYAYYHARKGDIRAGDKELLFSLKQVYQLYVVLLSIIVEVRELAVAISNKPRMPADTLGMYGSEIAVSTTVRQGSGGARSMRTSQPMASRIALRWAPLGPTAVPGSVHSMSTSE